MYKRILAPCLTVTAFSAAVALYNSTHSLPSKHCSKIKLCPQPQWAEPPGLKGCESLVGRHVNVYLWPASACFGELLGLFLGTAVAVMICCSEAVLHASIHDMCPRQRLQCMCSVHHSHDAPHAAGLRAEPAAGLPHQRQLLAPGGGAPGMPGHSPPSLLPAPQTPRTLGPSLHARILCACIRPSSHSLPCVNGGVNRCRQQRCQECASCCCRCGGSWSVMRGSGSA